MISRYLHVISILFFLFLTQGCKHPVKVQEDSIYSRHLQRHVKLTIITTPMPDDKSDMNLLFVNNGDDLERLDAEKIIDSLYKKNLIQPLTLVGIHGKAEDEYGITQLENNTGNRADKYCEFVSDELYPFVKKKTVIRKFRSVAICGCSLAGISAFDIAWQNADKIDKVGIFSGAFDYASKNDSSNIVLEKIRESRKRPHLQYWLFAAETNDSAVFNNSKTLINIIEKKNITGNGDITFIGSKNDNNDIVSWRRHFAAFLIWAFGK